MLYYFFHVKFFAEDTSLLNLEVLCYSFDYFSNVHRWVGVQLSLCCKRGHCVQCSFVAPTWWMVLQILLGLPFLISHPIAYISRAFNLGRVFIHFWYLVFDFMCFRFLTTFLHANLLACSAINGQRKINLLLYVYIYIYEQSLFSYFCVFECICAPNRLLEIILGPSRGQFYWSWYQIYSQGSWASVTIVQSKNSES